MPDPVPPLLRLVLRAYPRGFLDEFGGEIEAHLAHQRREPRYRAWLTGGVRFYWDVGIDALGAAAAMRLERAQGRGEEMGRLGRTAGGVLGPESGGVGTMLDAIGRDVRQAARGLRANPGYVFVFVVTLGLGIGANTAMFSAVNGVLLRPLPHAQGDRLVYLRHSAGAIDLDNALFSVPEITDYREGAPSLASVAEISALTFTMLGLDEPRRVRAGIVTGNYFEVMGLSAKLGRTIGREDDAPGAPAVVVLSEHYWRSGFGADPGIVGKTAEINGRTATFVGVAEPAPPYPERTEIYVNLATSPHHLDATMSHDRTHRMTEVFARLASGATLESARAEVSSITSRLHQAYPEAYDAASGYGVAITPLKTQLTTRARPTLLLLLGTASVVLIIACANLANLTLTRTLRRGHELAVRMSLGGTRIALRRQLLIESLLLGVGGAALGILLARVSLGLLVAFAERFTARATEITLDGPVLAFALLAAVGSSLFFTLLPPLPDAEGVGGALTRIGTRSTGDARAKRAQRALVAAQIGMSFVLLMGAGLLLRTMINLDHVDPGFDTTELLTLDIPSTPGRRTSAELRSLHRAILDDVEAIPAVEGVALTSRIPLSGPSIFGVLPRISVEGFEPVQGAPQPQADFRVVSPGYFATMGIRLRSGREFVTTDVAEAQKVVVLNETLAHTYFGDQDPLGRRIAWSDPNFRFIGLSPDWRTVVGVAADTRDRGLDEDVQPTMYTPYEQVTPMVTGSMVVRVNGRATSVAPAVRRAILSNDPTQPIDDVATLADLGSESIAPRRLNTVLLGAFALLALVIAAVGIGGVLAFSVGSRRREFGVRSALGAGRLRIWSGVVAEGAALAGAGLALGAGAAVLMTRFLAGLLVGVPVLDPVTFVSVAALLASVTVAAAAIPAWRAAGVDPLEALASE